MLRKQVFKTLAGAQKRTAFENAHAKLHFLYRVVRCIEGEPDTKEFNVLRYSEYTWQIERISKS